MRFNLVNGWLAQKLLFKKGLERRPVSMPAFRVLWPLLTQRRRLMPLVEPQGIYCFNSRSLIGALADLIEGRPCLEIGAGDGTLARFLSEAGVSVTATDDFSWQHSVRYPETVQRLGAREALELYRPKVVLCSWPPPGNTFERHVFKTRSVDLSIVIGTQHQVASGNWSDYYSQSLFEFAEDPRLSRLVLPPEIEPAVYVFRRVVR